MKRIEWTFGIGLDKNRVRIPDDVAEGVLDDIVERASSEFGGCTLLRGAGAWVEAFSLIRALSLRPSRDGATLDAFGVAYEPCGVLRVDVTDFRRGTFERPMDAITEMAAYIKKALNQQCVMWSVHDIESGDV